MSERRKSQTARTPHFSSEEEEANWWSSKEGRAFLKQQPASHNIPKGSPLVAEINRPKTVQIALRLPAPDLAKAREIADRKGIGYQTLLKMIVREGLQRESKRR
jgi:predicted DNA binding CopG/RHH family protein